MLTYLTTRPNPNPPILRNLYIIGNYEDPTALLLTDHDAPLLWRPWGTFLPAAVIKRGTIDCKIGLEVSSLSLTWSPVLAPFGLSTATANIYQRVMIGLFDNKPVRVFRTVMSKLGDCDTYGATQIFGGLISGATIEQGKIVLTVDSYMNALNLLVPPNVIENTNTLAGYRGATPVIVDAEDIVAQFTVVAPSSNTNILAMCTSPNAGKIYSTNKFRYGYIFFNPGSSLANQFSIVAANGNFNAGAGVHYNQFIVYAAFPWPPTPGDTFFASFKFPVDQGDPGALTLAPGRITWFPRVPSPETAI